MDQPPCVYYIHGGGMMSMSCFFGMYRAWGRIIAAQGIAVAMVDFRNCLTPSSAPGSQTVPSRSQRLRIWFEVVGGLKRHAWH